MRRVARLGLRGLAAGLAMLAWGAARAEAPRALAILEVGPESFDGEVFGLIAPGARVDWESLEVDLALPLRLRLNGSLARSRGLLRSEDWDTRADLGRALRSVSFVAFERALTLKLGALAHRDVGHGTIVSDFGNSLDPDRQPLGFNGRAAVGAFAVEALASDVLDPGVLGAIASVEPLSLGGGAPDDRVHAALSLFSDWTAPRGAAPRATVYGLGLDASVYRAEHVKVAPYLDLNGRGGGFGLHAGVLADLSFSGVDLSLRGEWRRAQLPYQPEYFDLAYSIERFALRTLYAEESSRPLPKAELTRGASNGGRAEVRFRARGFSASVSLSKRVTGENDASAVGSVELDSLEVAAFAAARAFAWGHNPQRVFAMLEARHRLSPFLHLWVAAGQVYRIQADGAAPAAQIGAGIGGAMAIGESGSVGGR